MTRKGSRPCAVITDDSRERESELPDDRRSARFLQPGKAFRNFNGRDRHDTLQRRCIFRLSRSRLHHTPSSAAASVVAVAVVVVRYQLYEETCLCHTRRWKFFVILSRLKRLLDRSILRFSFILR